MLLEKCIFATRSASWNNFININTLTTMSTTKKNGNMVAIITMFFIFAMISFVTNIAAPFGTIWGYTYEWAGMMGQQHHQGRKQSNNLLHGDYLPFGIICI